MSIARAWAGETVAVLATGPSLTQTDVDRVRGRMRVLAVNDAYRIAPWADALYATDVSWWLTHRGVPSFTGPKYSIDHASWDACRRARFADVQRLRCTGTDGIDTHPDGLRSGKNSGYAALNLAVHFGVSRILLLGYDLQHDGTRTHFFGNHPGSLNNRSPYHVFRAHFATAVAPLKALGISVVNCTPGSALTCFPRLSLDEALAVAVAA